jgi:hypothetical protein
MVVHHRDFLLLDLGIYEHRVELNFLPDDQMEFWGMVLVQMVLVLCHLLYQFYLFLLLKFLQPPEPWYQQDASMFLLFYLQKLVQEMLEVVVVVVLFRVLMVVVVVVGDLVFP